MARSTRRTVRSTGTVGGEILGTGNADDGGVHTGVDGDNGGSNNGTIIVDPADIGEPVGGSGSDGGNSTGSGDTPRRRGRKPGTASKKAVPLDVSGVENLLYSIHAMLAGITKTQELALDPSEARHLAEAMGKVSRHYDVTVGAKAMDWTNLLMVAGMVYGPRLVAIRENRKANRARPSGGRASAPVPNPPASETAFTGSFTN